MNLFASVGNRLNEPIYGVMNTDVAGNSKGYIVGLFPASNIDTITINKLSYSYAPTITLDKSGLATEEAKIYLGAIYLLQTKQSELAKINDARYMYNPTNFPSAVSSDAVNYIGDNNKLLFAKQINNANISDTIELNISAQKGYNVLAILVCPALVGYSTNTDTDKDVAGMLLVQGSSKYSETDSIFER